MTDERTLYTVAEIRQIEQTALATLPSYMLMQRAGLAAAEFARSMLSNDQHRNAILVLAGPGNNGGDAFEMATHLADSGLHTVVMFDGDLAVLPTDAKQAYQRAQENKAVTIGPFDCEQVAATEWSLIVDGLFGIGLRRPIQGKAADLILAINALQRPVLSLDVPSGLNADTGNVVGGDRGVAVRATSTITFIGNKAGLHTADGRDYAGTISVAWLEVAKWHFMPSAMRLNDVTLFAEALKPRRQNSHKGSFGNVVVLGGADGMVGAAILASRTAAKCGAGRVFIASPDRAIAYDDAQPEIMCRNAREMDFNHATIVAGPGLGHSRAAHDLLRKAIETAAPLVIDADALNLIAEETSLQQQLHSRRGVTLMTPHPLEAARLLGSTTPDVQSDRLSAARKLSIKFNATVVLKGSGTVIATPDQSIIVNATGNPALATAGSGDVLSGVCGALLAQHWPVQQAAAGAVWLHGKAADDLVEKGIGPIGVTASELIPYIRTALNQLVLQNTKQFKPGVPPKL